MPHSSINWCTTSRPQTRLHPSKWFFSNHRFYLTPIVYPLSFVPEEFKRYLVLNPLTPLVSLYREALLGGTMPPLDSLMPLAITATVALAIGIGVFRRLKPAFADEI